MSQVRITVEGCNGCPFATSAGKCWLGDEDEDADITEYFEIESTGHPDWCPLISEPHVVEMA